jgi:hypothetical protein
MNNPGAESPEVSNGVYFVNVSVSDTRVGVLNHIMNEIKRLSKKGIILK